MKLISIACLRMGAGRSEFKGWYADGRPRVRTAADEIQAGTVFEVDDETAARLIRSGSARVLHEAESMLADMQGRKS